MSFNQTNQELSNKQLIEIAPSIGALTPHETVSNKYSFVSTIEAINYLRDSGWMPIKANEVKARKDHKKGFQKHMVRFTRKDTIHLSDGSRIDTVLYNSHDRGCAFKLIGGIFRFICSNGVIVGNKMVEFSHKHMGFEPNEFIKSAQTIGSRMINIGNSVDQWQTLELTPNEQGIYAIAANKAVWGDESPVGSLQLLRSRRWENRDKADLWTTFNTVQENVIKGGLIGKDKNGKKRKTRAVKSIDKNRKLNQALWTLTEKMAELKAA